MQGDKWQRARDSFKDHKATVVLEDDNFLIVDWRNKNGSGNYAVRYILDIQKGNFIVTGDLGDSIACWYNKVTPENLKSYIKDIGYYLGKMHHGATSDDYSYNDDDALEDLESIKKDVLSWDYDVAEVEKDFTRLQELMRYLDIPSELYGESEVREIVEKYFDNWWDSGFESLGKRIAYRVYLWSMGFQMVCEQLGI